MVGKRVVAVVAGYAVLAAPLLANAQCKADVDCKGDRVCEQGRCVDPKTMQPDPPPPPAEAPPPPPPASDDSVKVTISDSAGAPSEDYSTGWAMPAAIIGFISAAAVLGLSIGSGVTVNREKGELDPFGDPIRDPIPSVPLGVAATVLTAALAPVVFVGGGSARRGAGATGLLGLRIAGWVAYGISLLAAVYTILFNVADIVKPPAALIVAEGAFGAASLVMFSIDALVAHGEASEGAISQSPSLSPVLVWAHDEDGSAIPALGLRGGF